MKLKILYHGTDLESAKEICGGNIDVKKKSYVNTTWIT